MSFETAVSVLRARFETEWGSTCPVAWPNAGFDPATDAPDGLYVKWTVTPGESWNAGFGDPGNNVRRFPGVVTVQIRAPLNVGDGDALALAEAVALIYNGFQNINPNIQFPMPCYNQIIGATDSDYRLNVVCPFFTDAFF